MMKRKLRLLRGDVGRGAITDPFFQDIVWFESKGRAKPRKSATDNNLAMVWTMQHDSWADVPRRAFSSSCTTSYDDAAQFGGAVYLIVPFDNVKQYAYCPVDFNYVSFGDGEGDDDLLGRLHVFINIQDVAETVLNRDEPDANPALKKILNKHKAALKRHPSDITNIQHIWQFCDAVSALIDFFKKTPAAELQPLEQDLQGEIAAYLDDFGMAPAAWLKKFVNPTKMKVSVHNSLANLPTKMSTSPEIWFEGQFIAMINPMHDDFAESPFGLPSEFVQIAKQVLG